MENWLNINQLRAIEWGLNSNEEKLCSYYSKEHKWVTSRITDNDGNFYNISISKSRWIKIYGSKYPEWFI